MWRVNPSRHEYHKSYYFTSYLIARRSHSQNKNGTGSKTDDCEENWLTNEKLQPKSWKAIKSVYDNSLTALISLLKEKDDAFL